jgi:5S rRNA maturation endonuclease (ribonuclease M5)
MELYNKLEEIPYNNFTDPYSFCLRYKTGNKCKYFDLDNHFDLIKGFDDKLQFFLMLYKKIYIIPLEFIDGMIYAFQLRSKDEKKFYNVKLIKDIPLVYGWKDIDRYDINVILTEGIKDYHTIKLIYPYVLAYLTSAPGEKLIHYLKFISKKIIIISDNDEAGYELRNKEILKGISKHYPIKHDCGVYWESDDNYTKDMIINNIKSILKKELFL